MSERTDAFADDEIYVLMVAISLVSQRYQKEPVPTLVTEITEAYLARKNVNESA